MKIIINHSSMVPIYEQLIEQIKAMILNEELKADDSLPSVRTLAREPMWQQPTRRQSWSSRRGKLKAN